MIQRDVSHWIEFMKSLVDDGGSLVSIHMPLGWLLVATWRGPESDSSNT
jgi:hypothetical protein